jgi:hypothetical protein
MSPNTILPISHKFETNPMGNEKIFNGLNSAKAKTLTKNSRKIPL